MTFVERSFASPTAEARYYILQRLQNGEEHSTASLKSFALSHMSAKNRPLCSRSVFSAIFTRLLNDKYIHSVQRGVYRITDSGLTYAQRLTQGVSSNLSDAPAHRAPASSDAAAEPSAAPVDPDVPLCPKPVRGASVLPSNDFTVQLHTALEAAHRTLEAACTFNVLHLSEQDFQLIREVEELLSRISDLEQKTV